MDEVQSANAQTARRLRAAILIEFRDRNISIEAIGASKYEEAAVCEVAQQIRLVFDSMLIEIPAKLGCEKRGSKSAGRTRAVWKKAKV